MHVKRISIDTNILVYAMDRDAGKRHVRAVKVVEQAVDSDCILTTQALGVFHGVSHILTEERALNSAAHRDSYG
ncbi:hypothetical protein [Acidithiobacillus sp. AMEEHan]|uniref:hypothetical protein n=1 Tax=Acidithiobacillus sp. AMEEHan TaxID=2994951 RepID=UPI0027E522B9|nr:hypothetical protein [Acidithiobacillus sp. AMEEHan]